MMMCLSDIGDNVHDDIGDDYHDDEDDNHHYYIVIFFFTVPDINLFESPWMIYLNIAYYIRFA